MIGIAARLLVSGGMEVWGSDMNDYCIALKAALDACFTAQDAATAAWHETPPGEPACTDAATLENLRNLVLREHLRNFQLWHVEDQARRRDVPDAFIADCKRRIDLLNQQRNDSIESVDACLCAGFAGRLPDGGCSRRNTETVGAAADRISILALKIYHMEEQSRRADSTPAHRETCGRKLEVLRKQRETLIRSVMELIDEYAAGRKTPDMYYQFKMYNDPALNPELHKRRD